MRSSRDSPTLVSISTRFERVITALMIAAFTAMSIGYSLGPLFEGPDEIPHYRFARDITTVGPMPDRSPDSDRDTYQYSQAPLYYLIQGTVKLLLPPDPDFVAYRDYDGRINRGWNSPQSKTMGHVFGLASSDNRNLWLHHAYESFPYDRSPTALVAHLMRLVSVMIGTAAVAACAGIFRVVWPDRPDLRLAALGFVAFWPTLQYNSSLISNDVMATLAGSLSLWLLVRHMRDGPTLRGSILLGAVLGLALLSKASMLGLAVPVGLAMLLDRRREWRHALLILAITLVIAGWWYGYRMVVYHDITGLNSLTLSPINDPINPGGLPPALIPSRIAVIYMRLWARYGPQAYIAPNLPIELFFILLSVAGLGGAGVQMKHAIRRDGNAFFATSGFRYGIVLGSFGLMLLAGVIYRVFTAWYGNQGRYLLPVAAGLAALIVFGLDAWTPARFRLRMALSLAAVMALVSMICLFGYFAPAYKPGLPPASIEYPRQQVYGDAVELIGIRDETITARPGAPVAVTLYWKALHPTDHLLTVFVQAIPPQPGLPLIRRLSYPGTGNLLSTDWLPGQMWSDRFVVTIPSDARPGKYLLWVAVMQPKMPYELIGPPLRIRDENGLPVTEPVGVVIVAQ